MLSTIEHPPAVPGDVVAAPSAFTILTVRVALDLVHNIARVRRLPVDVDLAYLAHIMLAEAGMTQAFGASVHGPTLVVRTGASGPWAKGKFIVPDRASPEVRMALARADVANGLVGDALDLVVETVVRPSVRLGADLDGYREGAEMDLSHYYRLRRNEVVPLAMWTEWLRSQIEHESVGAELRDVEHLESRRIRIVRQTQGRDRTSRILPVEAVFARLRLRWPNLEARDAALARGIGRHRSVGLGFLDPFTLGGFGISVPSLRWTPWPGAEVVS